MTTREERKAAIIEMCRKQGGFCTIADIRKAAGFERGDPYAKELAREGKLLRVDHDRYKVVTTGNGDSLTTCEQCVIDLSDYVSLDFPTGAPPSPESSGSRDILLYSQVEAGKLRKAAKTVPVMR